MHEVNEIEEILNRELHGLADGLRVPPLPVLPESAPRRPWLPVLAAAAVVVVLLGVIAFAAMNRDDSAPQPTPPTPSETKSTAPPVQVSTKPPTIPYTLDLKLYSDGEQVRTADWWYLTQHGPTWLAQYQGDTSWYWGQGREWSLIALTPSTPGVSPNGTYVAALGTENGSGILGAEDTRPPGRGLGNVPVDLDDQGLRVRAVTNDGKVIVQGATTSMLWLSEDGDRTVDLNETAPGVQFLDSTAAGLVATDGDESETYLAEISDEGEVTKVRDLPPSSGLVVSPGGETMAWAPLGSLAGEVAEIGSLEAGSVDGGQQMTFTPPDGWAFKVQDWAWEDDDNLVSTVVKNETERMVRCSVLTGTCVLIDAP